MGVASQAERVSEMDLFQFFVGETSTSFTLETIVLADELEEGGT